MVEWKQPVCTFFSLLAWCCCLGALATNLWIDDKSDSDYTVDIGVLEAEVTTIATGVTTTYDLDSAEIDSLYSYSDDLVSAGEAAVSTGILAVISLTLGIIMQVVSMIQKASKNIFTMALVFTWFAGFLEVLGMICYIGFMRENFSGDMGYNDSFALYCCSGLFIGIGCIFWWLGGSKAQVN